MKRSAVSILAAAGVLASCAAAYGPYDSAYQHLYGKPGTVEYGDGRHPGAVFSVPAGTPVIAAADGEVVAINPSKFGGTYVGVSHGEFTSWYGHLGEVRAKPGPVRRGDLLGLSGSDYTGRQYLHFRICQPKIFCNDFQYSLDPARHWLGGRLQCFERGGDYSRAGARDMTVPLACGKHALELLARAGS